MSRKAPAINTGAMADISFLLLTFFLLTSSITNEQGIPRMLPKKSDKVQDAEIRERNFFKIIVRQNGDIMVAGRNDYIKKEEISTKLKGLVKEFVVNSKNDPNLSERNDTIVIPLLPNFKPSVGVVSLECKADANYGIFITVQNELQAAYNEMRDEVSLKYFGQKFEVLDPESQKAVQQAVPITISEIIVN